MRERLDELVRSLAEDSHGRDSYVVYADALEEAGQHLRAELIRSEIAGNATRVRSILDAHERELLGPIALHAKRWLYTYGVPFQIAATFPSFAAHGAEMLRHAPITYLDLVDEGDDPESEPEPAPALGEAIARLPELRRIAHLELRNRRLSADLVRALLSSPNLTRLTSLEIAGRAELAAVVDIVAGASFLLERLSFVRVDTNDGDRVLSRIARSPRLQRLTQLRFRGSAASGAAITSRGTADLVASKGLASLEKLELGYIQLDDDACDALMTGVFQLRSFVAFGNRLRNIGSLFRAPCMAGVQVLGLGNNDLDDGVVDQILSWPNASNLQFLYLGHNPRLSLEARQALREAPCLSTCKVDVG